MVLSENNPYIIETHILPLRYGDLFISINAFKEPIYVFYERPWSSYQYFQSQSCLTIEDVLDEFIEPSGSDNYINTNRRSIINHITHTAGYYIDTLQTLVNPTQ